MPTLKDRWSEISPLLDEALELPPGAREPWLTDLAERSPELAAQVRSCLHEVEQLSERKFLDDSIRSPSAGRSRRTELRRVPWTGRSASAAWAPCGSHTAATAGSKGKRQ